MAGAGTLYEDTGGKTTKGNLETFIVSGLEEKKTLWQPLRKSECGLNSDIKELLNL